MCTCNSSILSTILLPPETAIARFLAEQKADDDDDDDDEEEEEEEEITVIDGIATP